MWKTINNFFAFLIYLFFLFKQQNESKEKKNFNNRTIFKQFRKKQEDDPLLKRYFSFYDLTREMALIIIKKH